MLGKVMKIGVFVGAVVAAHYVGSYAWRAFAPHHSDSPAVQGAAAVLS